MKIKDKERHVRHLFFEMSYKPPIKGCLNYFYLPELEPGLISIASKFAVQKSVATVQAVVFSTGTYNINITGKVVHQQTMLITTASAKIMSLIALHDMRV